MSNRSNTELRDLMTQDLVMLPASASIFEAAAVMLDKNVGDVLVEEDGKLIGIVTDRDLVVRGLAKGTDSSEMNLGSLCTRALVWIDAAAAVEDAIRLMRDYAIRRLPVVDKGRPVGIVSLGDLAIDRERKSTLGEISAASPSH